MLKATAINLLGGTVIRAAIAIGISPQAISRWPDRLSPKVSDRVVAAVARQGGSVKRALHAQRVDAS